jgi:hypothetical protein
MKSKTVMTLFTPTQSPNLPRKIKITVIFRTQFYFTYISFKGMSSIALNPIHPYLHSCLTADTNKFMRITT